MRSQRKSEFVTDGSKIQRCAAFCFHPAQSLCSGYQQSSCRSNGKNATECKAYSVPFFPAILQTASGGTIIHRLQSSAFHLKDNGIIFECHSTLKCCLVFSQSSIGSAIYRPNPKKQSHPKIIHLGMGFPNYAVALASMKRWALAFTRFTIRS